MCFLKKSIAHDTRHICKPMQRNDDIILISQTDKLTPLAAPSNWNS